MKTIKTGSSVGNVVVWKGDPTQLRKIRCPACHGDGVSGQDAQGRPVNTCSTCKRQWRSVKM